MDWKDGVILAGAGLGILAWDTWRSYKDVKVDIAAYQITDVDFPNNTATLQIDIELTNPLLLGLTLYSIVGDIYLDGEYVASINQVFDYYIRGKRTHIIPVVIVSNLFSVSTILLQKLFRKAEDLTLRFAGEVRLGAQGIVPIPVDLEETIKW